MLLVAGAVAVLVGNAAWRRPLWYDEVWRAYQASLPGSRFWSDLSAAAGPNALGWLGLTRLAGTVFGWHAWAVRSVSVTAVVLLGPAVFLLARRYVGRVAAAACAVLAVFNAATLDQGTQLKPYVPEMLAAVLILLLWPVGGRVVLRLAAVAVVSLVMLPAPFVVGPLAVLHVASVRRWRALLEACVAVVPVALHTLLFAGRQSNLRGSTYWNANFLSGRSLTGGLDFVADQLRAIVRDIPPNLAVTPRVAAPLSTVVAVLPWLTAAFLLTGLVVLCRSRRGRLLVATVLGAEALMLVASAARAWPFGAVRTNLFLAPLLLIVAAAGATWLASLLPRRVAAVPAAALLTALALVAATSTAWMWQRRAGLRYGDQMTRAALQIRATIRPGDLVAATAMADYNLRYALTRSADGTPTTAPHVPDPAIVLLRRPGDGTLATTLRATRPPHLHLVLASGLTGPGFTTIKTELSTVDYCTAPVKPRVYQSTALVVVYQPCRR